MSDNTISRRRLSLNEFNLPNIEDEQTILKSIRIKSSTIRKVNELSKKTNLSVNRILNECIEQALKVLTEKEFSKIQEEEGSENNK